MDDVRATAETLESFVTDAERELSSQGTRTLGAELPAVGSIIAERYRLERLLGQGGMGAVFAGRHVVTGRQVAIKILRDDPVLHREAALRMAREARAVGRVQHPNVVAVYDAGFSAGRPFIAMELLDGESLEQRIDRTGPMHEREAISTLEQLARGVAAAHANGIIHRDLKPANILLCRPQGAAAELVKVVDFGISKLQDDGAEDVLVTSEGVQLGTPVFMSPEQVRGDVLDERSDVYALAVILYYMLTRRFPFQARSRAELFAKILTAQPEPLLGVSPAVASVVLKGLARERTQRYASVAALANALSQPRLRSRSSLTKRVVYLAAAASGMTLALMPTRLMHAAPSYVAAVTAPTATPAEPLPAITTPAAPPVAAKQATPDPPRTPSRLKPRAARPSPQPAAPVARDDTTTDEVKLMSW